MGSVRGYKRSNATPEDYRENDPVTGGGPTPIEIIN